ncbi:hypothetical protein LWI28_025147 [Acer negundo]|uniref:Uncharacterized protein n=1 Tax=Acer negundo TaxID=4023 RepID=A0AAD5J153_ACENE|nr:hypothetical protein LWI28_025147 [Acer negundo]
MLCLSPPAGLVLDCGDSSTSQVQKPAERSIWGSGFWVRGKKERERKGRDRRRLAPLSPSLPLSPSSHLSPTPSSATVCCSLSSTPSQKLSKDSEAGRGSRDEFSREPSDFALEGDEDERSIEQISRM